MRSRAVLLLAAAFALVLPGAARAGFCGGSSACACGDMVVESVVLTADIGVCTGTGLRVASNVVLDCALHTVEGNNESNAKFGIFLEGVTGAEVRNCRVTGFRRGLRIEAGSGNRLSDNDTFANKYGIDLAGATSGNAIVGNLVRENRDEGVHMGTGSMGNRLLRNELRYNKRENLYLLASDGNVIKNNLLHHSNGSAIYIKHSSNNRFVRNEVRDTSLQLRGDSTGNVFRDNYLKGDGYIFQAHEELTGWTYPHGNRLRTDCIRKTDFCYRFFGAYDNHATGARTDGRCDPPVTSGPSGGQEAVDNTVVLSEVTCNGPPW